LCTTIEGLECSKKLPLLPNKDELKGPLEAFFDIVAFGLYHIL